MSNSTFCGVQGTIIVYIALVMLCLAVLLIANLHVLTVFQSVIIQRNMTKLIIFTFILPLASIIPVALRKEFEYPGFGSVCFIKSDIAGPFFFYPLSIFACIGALMHLGTIGYMVKATIRATATSVNSAALRSHSDSQSNAPMSATKLRLLKARNITRILKKQWRAGFFAICLIAVDMTYWLFYFIEAKKAIGVNADTPWLTAWAGCILYADPNADRQSACLDVARPNVPKFAWIVTTEVFPASLGLITFITFGSKLAFWQDVFSALFCGLRKRDSTVFVMNDITRDSEQGKLGRSELQSSENFDEKQTGHRVQDYNDKGGIYSGESSLNPSAYNSRDILSNTFSQDFTKENAIPSMPSPPTATPYNTKAALGGPTRKASVRIVEEREPILYVNPASKLQSEKENNENQKKIAIEKEHQRAKLVSEGSEPWPSWPTTTTTSSVPRSFSESFSPARRRPDLTVCTEGDIPTPNHHNLLSPTTQHMPSFVPSPAPVYSTPTSPGFYNFEDIGISPDFGQHEQVNHGPSIIPARTSSRSPHYQGRSQQSGIQYSGKRSLDYQSRNHGSASTTPVSPYYPASPTSSSPPPIPPKSQSRKTSLT
ncbi:hypothetical protein BGZ76_008963 [Entomortierella beljakovae]|nr:hypothetical protein BGZ76_008963 [Entomortierella beljakovae]